MSKFTLSTLAAKLAEKSGLSQTEAELFIRKMFDVLNQGLEADKQVKMRWLGTFKVTTVKDRESVDVNTGERIVIEGRDKISYTPDNILKEIVNKPFAQFETVVVNDGVEFDDIDKKFETPTEAPQEVPQEVPSEIEVPKEEPVAAEVKDPEKEEPIAPEQPQPIVSEQPQPVAPIEPTLPVAEFHSSAPDVIDFLDTPSSLEPSSEVVVIGEEKVVQPEVQPKIEPVVEQTDDSLVKPITEPISEPEEVVEQHPQMVKEEPVVEQKTVVEQQPEVEDEEEPRHSGFVLPKYVVVAAVVVFLVLAGGIGWFTFNYAKMAEQNNYMMQQLAQLKENDAQRKAAAEHKQMLDAQEARLREKAKQDSIRMASASEAIKMAENADGTEKVDPETGNAKDKANQNAQAKEKESASTKTESSKAASQSSSSKYDNDVRVRTGAYRIVGVAQVVKVSGNQSLQAISDRYLGPGMECYVEALNGTTSVKAGQSIKIPKLELKKKK